MMNNEDDPDEARLSKREERRLARRRSILSVAATSFLTNGYTGTTMTGISAKLGGSKGTLWRYFASKEELFVAFLDDATSAFKQEMNAILKPSGDLRETLKNFAERYIGKISSPNAIRLYRLMAAESGRFPELGQMFSQRAPEAVREIVTEFLVHHIQSGNLAATDPVDAAKTLLGLCLGRSHHHMLCGGNALDPAEFPVEAALIVDIFLQYYGTVRRPM